MHSRTTLLADAANRDAGFDPMRTDDERPTITVAGVRVAVYVGSINNQVCVAVDLDDTEPWLLRRDAHLTIPLHVCVQGDVVYEA